MPKRLQLSPHASTEELEHRYRKAKDPVERSHHQIVWLLSEGGKQKKLYLGKTDDPEGELERRRTAGAAT